MICRPSWKLSESGSISHRIYLVRGGGALYRESGRVVPLEKDTCYVLPSSRKYSITHHPERPLETIFYYVFLAPDFSNELIRLPFSKSEPLKRFADFLAALYGENNAGLMDPAAAVRQILALVFCSERPRMTTDERVLKTISLIRSHFNQPLSLRTMASTTGLEPHYFLSLFRRQTGKTPIQYLFHFRMEEAAHRLASGMSVAKAARECGFENVSTFSRSFKKHFQATPTSHRAMLS